MRRYETRKSLELKAKRQRRSNIFAMFAAVAVVLILSIVIWNGKQSLAVKDTQYESRITELNAQIAEQESRSDSLEEYKKYVKTKKYAEEMAKEKFGLLYPDELVFKPTE